MSDRERHDRSSTMPRRRMTDYIFSVIFNIAFLVVVNKVGKVPDVYPRRPGVPSKRPLR